MKLKDNNSIFNMGDTSLRVLRQVEAYSLILKQLADFSHSGFSWSDKFHQEEFYRSVHKEIIRLDEEDGVKIFEDFNRAYIIPTNDKIGQRARTWTNPLVKNGFIDSNRKISIVGNNYLSDNLRPSDRLESLMTQDKTNLLYFRQYLKLKIYSSDSKHYFYNFRFAIKFLLEYKDVPKNEFFRIIESIRPTYSNGELSALIDDYVNVKEGKVTFEAYYTKHFEHSLTSKDELNLAKKIFENNDFSSEKLDKCFYNKKSTSSQKVYKEFVINLVDLINNKTESAYKKIQDLSKLAAIKKAFGFNNNPFSFKKNQSIEDFFQHNCKNQLLDTNHFKIYQQFLISKRFDLIREYSDMCFRSFQSTGIFNFSNGLVNLNYEWLFKPLLSHLDTRFDLCGEDDYDSYENDEDSIWYKDVSLIDIFNITEDEVLSILLNIKNEFKLENINLIHQYVEDKKEREYKEFILTKFSKNVVINILDEINKRNDKKVFELVTPNATIPTIFEYILTIAWFHISKNKDYLLHKSFQLTLDGDKLPLTHRGGGAGDIEIITPNYALLIEATLMNSNNQKRGELEPVIRHSINFKLQQNCNDVQTLFIANELDTNVLNIFRAMQFVKLHGSLEKGEVEGLNIFALTTSDLIEILKRDIRDDEILPVIKKNLMSEPMKINTGWHEPIKQQIFCN